MTAISTSIHKAVITIRPTFPSGRRRPPKSSSTTVLPESAWALGKRCSGPVGHVCFILALSTSHRSTICSRLRSGGRRKRSEECNLSRSSERAVAVTRVDCSGYETSIVLTTNGCQRVDGWPTHQVALSFYLDAVTSRKNNRPHS
jgi:hypothetical protein